MNTNSCPDLRNRLATLPAGALLPEELAFDLLRDAGIPVPLMITRNLDTDIDAGDLADFPGDRVVVKALAPELAHKSDVGGVRVVARSEAAVRDARDAMVRSIPSLTGISVSEFVAHEPGLATQILLGLRWSPEFGALVTLAPGGVFAEHLAAGLRPDRAATILAAGWEPAGGHARVLRGGFLTPLITGGLRAQKTWLTESALVELVDRLTRFARRWMPEEIAELEVNPVVLTETGPVAIDVLARRGTPAPRQAPPIPPGRIAKLLRPESMAIMGVSAKANPGRIMVENTLHRGFDPRRLFVIKPGVEEVLGCPAVPDVASLPHPVDVLVLSVAAAAVPEVLRQTIAGRKAETIILIPGGLGERKGTSDLAGEVRDILDDSRATDWGGPVVNGGNCLGIRSLPGNYDTLFLPRDRFGRTEPTEAPLAIVAQSGAFAAARLDRLAPLNPRYVITVGNQLDLTLGDYLAAIREDPAVRVIACYVEGFRPGDGMKWLRETEALVREGRTVILYRAGRTPAGQTATASHTAAIAGDYAVSRGLAEQAGALVAETLEDFDDLVTLACRLGDREFGGPRVAALSNAGFECVAMADRLGALQLAEFGDPTREQLQTLLEQLRLESIVDPGNPMDITPIAGDAAFVESAAILLRDPRVDLGVIGCVPLTGALDTIQSGPDSVTEGLIELWREGGKPWIAVVDAGRLYDGFADALEGSGIPVFRRADQALRLLDMYAAQRLGAASEK